MEKGGRTMRKRRVLAVLLALSLVVSGNGMTVLAAETGTEQPVVTVQTETPELGEDTGESVTPETTEENITPGETQKPEDGGTSEETQKPETPDGTENPGENGTEVPGENEAPDEAETPDETEDPDAPKEDEATEPTEEEPAEEEEPVEEIQEPEKEEAPVQNYVSRIVTFTDDTGMQVTYDANASTQYHYEVTDGVLTAVKIKKTDAEGNEILEDISFTGNVELKQPEEGDPYTSVAASVFSGNDKITYVKLPAGVTTVTAGAFKGCTALKGVYLPASVNKIENSAFENCTAMTQISVPKAVTVIGDAAFKGDARLYLVYIKDADYSELQSIGAEAFSGCAVLAQFCSHSDFIFPIKLETIGDAAFRDCKTIKKVDFSANKSLTAIGKITFAGCTGLTDLTPGKTLTEIPEGAFSGCNALACINFETGKNMTIGKAAFQGCYNLKQLVLPQSITKICQYAFQGCTKLKQVDIRCYNIEIEALAFDGVSELVIVADEDSNGYNYALENGFKIPGKDAFYRYTVEDVDGRQIEDGVFPGGTIWVGTGTQTKKEENINTQNEKKGIKSGETCYIYRSQTKEQENSFTFIAESLRCNGKAMQKKDGKYFFEMPVGGAVITAEFRAKTPENIEGQQVTVEFSNGTPMKNGATDSHGYLGVELKVGQTSRMFLLDKDGNPIPATKLSDVKSNKEGVAKVDKRGVITAVGIGTAQITVKLKGGDGNDIIFSRTVEVKAVEAKSIILKASDYKTIVKVEGAADGIQTAAIKKTAVEDVGQKFKLKANVYDDEEGISKELTWTTSNAKVAVLKTGKTTAENPINEVSIPAGCEGEATITVTAKNPADSEKEKVTQKFVVRVYEEGFRLTSSAVTVNPRMKEGAAIDLISAYGIGLENAQLSLYQEKSKDTTEFMVVYDADESSETCKRFRIKPISDVIPNGTHKVRVCVDNTTNEEKWMPLTITVKSSAPNPTVRFNTNKAKFNLFYKDGGTDAEGNQMSVITEITKLGDVKVKKAVLEPLSQKDDDRLFTENFVIDTDNTDLAKGKVAIKRSAGALKYTPKNKAVVAGYLVLYFDGYDDSAAKKVKVTMPTCTTAPSWALRTTKGTYRSGAHEQNLTLELFDKKSKTKEQVVLDASYTVTAEPTGDVRLSGEPKVENGKIVEEFTPNKGSIKLELHNEAWDRDQKGNERTLKFTYNVGISTAKPTVKTDQGSVSLNLNYPEKPAQFTLVSNMSDTTIADAQTFTRVVTNAKQEQQIRNLQVTYENGVGTVSIMSGQTVNKGTYKFECNPSATGESDLKKVTLTVKVVDSKPGVKFGKGSLQLNTVVYQDNQTNSSPNRREDVSVNGGEQSATYREISERTFKVTGMPEGYTLASVGSGADNTEIVCTTRNRADAVNAFIFEVVEDVTPEKDNVLRVSLKDPTLAKGTYNFKMTPRYVKADAITVSAQSVNFQVKVISETDIHMTVSARGKINLVNREGEANDKNGIVYTPTLKNLVGEIEAVKIYDPGSMKVESKYFDISLIEEGKDAGKFYVTPKKIRQTKADGSTEYTYVELENNKQYQVCIWAKVKGYAGSDGSGGVLSKTVRIKTGQTLPKVTLSKTGMDVYLSTKTYNANFVVKPKEGSVGTIEEIYFSEKDEMANDSFELIQVPQADGSMKVTVHLKEAVGFANGTTNNVKFYVKYKGQGTNTSQTATGFTMKIKVN